MEVNRTFSPSGDTQQCVTISIVEDTILESTEIFRVLLSSSSPDVRLLQNVTEISVRDDDGIVISLLHVCTGVCSY